MANDWTLHDIAPIAHGFEPAASPSSLVYWGSVASLQFDPVSQGTPGTATPAGVSMLSAVGTPTATGQARSSPAGVAMVALLGAPMASGAAVAAPSGRSATSAVGSPAATGSALAAPAGVSMLSAVGDATAAGGTGQQDQPGDAFPAGVAMLASVGESTTSGAALAEPAGVALVAAVGTVAVDGGPADGIAAPLGIEMVATVGSALAFDADVVVVSGGMGGSWGRPFRAQADAPISELRVSVTVFPFGVEATMQAGRPIAAGDASIAVAGLEMAAAIGDVQAGADAVTAVPGVSTGVLVGKAAAFDVHVLPVRRYMAFRIDAMAAPLGVEAQAAAGVVARVPDAIDRAWADLQTEDAELFQLGVLP